jgi:hypothetical protein
VLAFDVVLHLLPLHPERRVGEQVVEALTAVAVVAEGVTEGDVAGVLSLDQQVRGADRPGLGVQFLPVGGDGRVRVVLGDVFLHRGKHPAGAAGGIEHRTRDPGDREHLSVWGHQDVDHQLDDLARGEMLPGGLVREFRETPDQLLEHVAHLMVRDHLRPQIEVREPGDHWVEQVRGVQPLDLLTELELLQHVPRVLGEGADVGGQVGGACAVSGDLGEVVAAGVVEDQPPVARRRKLGRSYPWPSRCSLTWRTLSLVGSSTHSSRRSTVNGRITLP